QAAAAKSMADLTPREHAVMELVLAGRPSKNIAFDLGISQRTVENHRAAIMKKTGSKSIPALIRLALAAVCTYSTRTNAPEANEASGALSKPASDSRQLPDNRPGVVGLLAGNARGRLRTSLDEDLLAVIGATESVGIVVVADDAEIAVVAVPRIAPFIGGVGTARIEAVVVRLVGVALIFAIEISGHRRAKRAADDHAGNGRAAAIAVLTDGVPNQATDQCARDDAGGIG